MQDLILLLNSLLLNHPHSARGFENLGADSIRQLEGDLNGDAGVRRLSIQKQRAEAPLTERVGHGPVNHGPEPIQYANIPRYSVFVDNQNGPHRSVQSSVASLLRVWRIGTVDGFGMSQEG